MVAGGEKKIVAIIIVAKRQKFTPCGGCMDWIFQFGGKECKVAFQPEPGAPFVIYTAGDLMPHYPA
jgi:cytidine deaminase